PDFLELLTLYLALQKLQAIGEIYDLKKVEVAITPLMNNTTAIIGAARRFDAVF
ncbi:26275_t:CDS:1, partial [Gigaspora margarita]